MSSWDTPPAAAANPVGSLLKRKTRDNQQSALADSDAENQPESQALVTTVVPLPDGIAPGPARLPQYSFKQYRPSPAVVYTRDVTEANEMVQLLKGPLGFDLEWSVNLRRGKRPMERRTALVQLSDSRMILLVQVSAMKSTIFHCRPSDTG